MVHLISKYLLIIGVVLLGFQHNAFADEKDKDQTKVTKSDTIKIKVNLDIHADDTLVFDDFDEDDDDKGDNSSIAFVAPTTSIQTSNYPSSGVDVPPTSETNQGPTSQDPTQPEDSSVSPTPFPIHTKVYPNPASASSDHIYIEHNLTDIAQVIIYSISGNIVYHLNTHENKIEVDGLSVGMYIVNISGSGTSESKKLLIQ